MVSGAMNRPGIAEQMLILGGMDFDFIGFPVDVGSSSPKELRLTLHKLADRLSVPVTELGRRQGSRITVGNEFGTSGGET